MITFDKLIKNFETFNSKGTKLMEKEIFNLFEPIVYQIVLTTRMDTGKSRASLGIPFTKIKSVSSQRIIDAVEYDVEVNAPAYYHWTHRAYVNPLQDYLGDVKRLVSGRKIQVEIVSYEKGVENQEDGEIASHREDKDDTRSHPREDYERHIPHHISEITAVLDSSDLENFNGGGLWLPDVAQDIRERIKDVYKKVEELLFT